MLRWCCLMASLDRASNIRARLCVSTRCSASQLRRPWRCERSCIFLFFFEVKNPTWSRRTPNTGSDYTNTKLNEKTFCDWMKMSETRNLLSLRETRCTAAVILVSGRLEKKGKTLDNCELSRQGLNASDYINRESLGPFSRSLTGTHTYLIKSLHSASVTFLYVLSWGKK